METKQDGAMETEHGEVKAESGMKKETPDCEYRGYKPPVDGADGIKQEAASCMKREAEDDCEYRGHKPGAADVEGTHAKKRVCAAPDSRSWSKNLEPSEQTEIYTIRAHFGDPREPIPSWIQTRKKDVIQAMMRQRGFDDVTGTKPVLLERMRTGGPFVEFEIDSRECLQRMLNVALSQWGWDEGHAFQASMPRRGSNQLGCTKLGCSDDYIAVLALIEHRWDYLESSEQQSAIARWVKRGLSQQVIEQLIDGTLTRNDWAPTRVVGGSGIEPDDLEEANDDWLTPAKGGALSLQSVALRRLDHVKMTYDLGDSNTLVFQVRNVQPAPLLPEVDFANSCGNHPTRAKVVERGGARIPQQYGGRY